MVKTIGYHVVPRGRKWAERRSGAMRATRIHETEDGAVVSATEKAIRDRSVLWIHGADGRVRDRRSFEGVFEDVPFCFGDVVLDVTRPGWRARVTAAATHFVGVMSELNGAAEAMPPECAIARLRVLETAEGKRVGLALRVLMESFAFEAPCACGRGECSGKVKWRPSLTAYHWEGEGHDPNGPKLMCDPCWEEYEQMMDSMWADAQPTL